MNRIKFSRKGPGRFPEAEGEGFKALLIMPTIVPNPAPIAAPIPPIMVHRVIWSINEPLETAEKTPVANINTQTTIAPPFAQRLMTSFSGEIRLYFIRVYRRSDATELQGLFTLLPLCKGPNAVRLPMINAVSG